jgi:hypothetical protein
MDQKGFKQQIKLSSYSINGNDFQQKLALRAGRRDTIKSKILSIQKLALASVRYIRIAVLRLQPKRFQNHGWNVQREEKIEESRLGMIIGEAINAQTKCPP